MKTVLFICTGNAGRSQIAAALFAKLTDNIHTVISAGVDPWDDLHPVGRQLLEERHYTTTGLHPKHTSTYADTPLDIVVTIGDRAHAGTPRYTSSPLRIHWPITDPADADGTGQERPVFLRTWDLIAAEMPALVALTATLPEHEDATFTPGISTCIFRPGSFDPTTHIPLIADAGFTCIELCNFFGSQDYAWDQPRANHTLRTVAADHGIRIHSLHVPSGLGIFQMGHSRTMALDLIKAHTHLACELGATVVPMHAGPNPNLDPKTAHAQLTEDLQHLADFAHTLPTTYAWENEPKGLTTTQHLDWIRQLGHASFGFVLDPGHANIANTTDAYLDHAHDLLISLHINDNDAKQDQHVFPGAGNIDWTNYLNRIRALNYTGPLMLEVQANDRQHQLPTVLAEARATIDHLHTLSPTKVQSSRESAITP